MKKDYKMKAESGSYKLSGNPASFSLVKKFVKEESLFFLISSLVILAMSYFNPFLGLVSFVVAMVKLSSKIKKFTSKK